MSLRWEGFSIPNFAFLDKNFPIRRRLSDYFPTTQNWEWDDCSPVLGYDVGEEVERIARVAPPHLAIGSVAQLVVLAQVVSRHSDRWCRDSVATLMIGPAGLGLARTRGRQKPSSHCQPVRRMMERAGVPL